MSAKRIITVRSKQYNRYDVYFNSEEDFIFKTITDYCVNINVSFCRNFSTYSQGNTIRLVFAPIFMYEQKK